MIINPPSLRKGLQEMKGSLKIYFSAALIFLITILLGIYATPLREGFQQTTTPIEVSLNLNCVNTGSTVSCTADTSKPMVVETLPPPNPLAVPDAATRQALATKLRCPMDDSGVPPACRLMGQPNADKTLRIQSRAECQFIGGNWSSNGECGKPTGGSFSQDCRCLNVAPPNSIRTSHQFPCTKEICKDLGAPGGTTSRRYTIQECTALGGKFVDKDCKTPENVHPSVICRCLNTPEKQGIFKTA